MYASNPLALRALGLALCAALTWRPAQGAPPDSVPVTPRVDVFETYHGVRVADPFRWLEDARAAQVRNWSATQDARTRRYLAGLAQRRPMAQWLMKKESTASDAFYALHAAGDRVFAMLRRPSRQQPMLAVMGNAADPAQARVVVDPNRLNPRGTTAIDWFVPSPDGRLVAVSLSDNGSEVGALHLFDVATGQRVDAIIPGVQFPTAGGSLAWRADSQGFWVTRYPGPERAAPDRGFFQQVYFHRLGDAPARDAYVFGKELPKVAEIMLTSGPDGRDGHVVLAAVANGDGGEFAHFVIDADNRVRQFASFQDGIVAAVRGPDGATYLLSRQGAPRGRLLKLPADDLALDHAQVIVAESEAVMQTGNAFSGAPIVVTARRIYVRELVGGPSRVAIFDHEGSPHGELPLPQLAAVNEIEPLGDGTLLVSVQTWLKPPTFSRYDEATGQGSDTRLAQVSPVGFADTEVVREFAPSKDGTAVPLTIVRRKGTRLDGSHPVLLSGYGGYGISLTPSFLGARTRLWLDAGGIYVIANLRGGGEFGATWHLDGALTRKQNVFDDFIGAAEFLIARHYTTPARLAIQGGSNGGLLMGAALTQRPELFRAVVALVGMYDMLRVELDPNGAFNVTEFGSVAEPAQFKALLAYSPYHRVVDGTSYPAVFMATGANDGRVNPAQSRKMTARLQAATASGRPVFLSIEASAGHGIDSSLSVRVGQMADIYSFLFDQLGMTLRSH